MAGQLTSIIYTEDVDPIFTEFRRNKSAMDDLRAAYMSIKSEFLCNSLINLRTLCIKSANAGIRQSFSGASCTFEHFGRRAFTGGSVYLRGLRVLERYLCDNLQVPEDENKRRALQKLLQFLNSSHSELTLPNDDENECYWAIHLAEHLLSKLALENGYTIDHQYSKPHSMNMEDRQKMEGVYGDTSFGCSDAWHGSVDIMMGNSVPVNVVTADDGRDMVSNISESSEEMNANDFRKKDLKEIMAQAIVFSFLQKSQGSSLNNGALVPTIGISKDKLIVFFYDCENDILLHSPKLTLFGKDDPTGVNVGILAVVFLWLTLNYKYLSSGIVEEMRDEKADFFSIAGPFLEKYRKEIQRPCHVMDEDEDLFDVPINFRTIEGTLIEDSQEKFLSVFT